MATTSAPSIGTSTSHANGSSAQAKEILVYVNGQMLPKSQATVSVFDHGLLYGDGCFEGIRVYKGKIFKCERHLDRLWKCAEQLRIKIPISRQEMTDIQRRCIAANNLTDGYIRLIVTRGVGTLGLNPFLCPTPGIICIADQIRLYPPDQYQTGMRVIVAKRPKTPIACLDPRIKSLNYLNNILAKVEAIDAGCLEAIMLNTDGFVSECTGDNIFIVKGGEVFTPPTEAGLLEGITREFVMKDLCKAEGIRCSAKMLRLDDVLNAEEVFLTGTAAEMIAVTQIDDKIISKSEGPVTKRLRARFHQVVTTDPIPED